MSQKTTNYQLTKPAPEDFVDIGDLNDNFDALDTALKSVADTAEAALPTASYTGESILTKLKTVDGTGSGLDADLFKGSSTVAIANGGTGAATAADARNNLGVAPASEHNMKTYTSLGQIGLSGAPTMDEIQEALPNNSRLVFNPATSAYTEGTETANVPSLYGMVVMEKIDPSRWDISFRSKTGPDALWVGIKGKISGDSMFKQWVKIPSTATLASDIQSLLQGGSISVVKSVQRGTMAAGKTTDGTITITSVNMNKAFVNLVGTIDGQGGPVRLKLSSATSVAWARSHIYGAGTNTDYSGFSWEVIEFY